MEVYLISLRNKGRVAAKGTLKTTDSKRVIGGSMLGTEFVGVYVDGIENKGDEELPRPLYSICTLIDDVGFIIPWPKSHVSSLFCSLLYRFLISSHIVLFIIPPSHCRWKKLWVQIIPEPAWKEVQAMSGKEKERTTKDRYILVVTENSRNICMILLLSMFLWEQICLVQYTSINGWVGSRITQFLVFWRQRIDCKCNAMAYLLFHYCPDKFKQDNIWIINVNKES